MHNEVKVEEKALTKKEQKITKTKLVTKREKINSTVDLTKAVGNSAQNLPRLLRSNSKGKI